MHDDDDGPLGSPILDFEAEAHRFRCYFADRVIAMRPADGPKRECRQNGQGASTFEYRRGENVGGQDR